MDLARERFLADPAAIRAALIRIEAGPAARLAPPLRETTLLVLAELLNNVAEHAYGGGRGPVAVSLWLRDGVVNGRIVDRGIVAPRIGAGSAVDPALLPEGGFGLGLIRLLTERMDQRRLMDCNVIHFRIAGHNG